MTASAPLHRRGWSPLVPAITGVAAAALFLGGFAMVSALTTDQSNADQSNADQSNADPSSAVIASETTSAAPTPAPTALPGAAGRIRNPAAPAASADRTGIVVSRVQIPAIGVDAAVEQIGRGADGVLEPPTAWADAGWYGAGVLPGAIGPAVIAGHLDTTERAAVFARLEELVAGDRVTVTLSDGSRSTFSVDSAIDVEKAAFPTAQVYGPTPDPQLRLIPCNGPYDDAEQAYSNNVVVFASLVPAGG